MKTQTIIFKVNIESFEDEEWRIVEGWGLYAISNKGRVFSCKNEKLMIPQKPRHKTNHLKIRLSSKGKWKGLYVHRLVAIAFIPNPENKIYINHKDANPLNNCVENLEWCTPSENTTHAYLMGLQVMPTNRSRKLNVEKVIEIRNRILIGERNCDIGRIFNVSSTTISSIRNGENWACLPSIPSLIAAGYAIAKNKESIRQ